MLIADWVFLGTLRSSPWISDIEKMKSVKLFDDFIEMGDTDLINLGVESLEVRGKILGAIKTWNDEHQLPGLILTPFLLYFRSF